MNIESKLLIRYGIPGWYFILCLFILSKLIDIDIEDISSLSNDILSSVVLTVLGVPVGYILYQIYFMTTHRKHINQTPDWNVFVFKNISYEDRDYVNSRYSHMLGSIHEIGVLRITFLISGLIIYFFAAGYGIFEKGNLFERGFFFTKEFYIMVGFTFINFIFVVITTKNYKFKQRELMKYVRGIKNSVNEQKSEN